MKTLLSEEQLCEGIGRLANEIQTHYQGRPLTVIGVMIESITLLADLLRLVNLPLQVELVQARKGRSDGGHGPLVVDPELLSESVAGRHVLLVDDIFDTGRTMWDLIPQIDELRPASVRSAVLLRKQGRATVALKPDFVGFDIPDGFVVGYGLHYQGRYHNLASIALLEPAEMAQA
jgi:hypoxanthine phosphoribosyltransferase